MDRAVFSTTCAHQVGQAVAQGGRRSAARGGTRHHMHRKHRHTFFLRVEHLPGNRSNHVALTQPFLSLLGKQFAICAEKRRCPDMEFLREAVCRLCWKEKVSDMRSAWVKTVMAWT